MKKLLTGTAIVFMMVLTASLVSAASTSQPTAIYPWSGSGTIYFIDNETGTVTPETGAQITLNQAVTTTGEPQNFYYGFITLTLPGGSIPTNISISAIVGPEDPKAWHISGSSPLLLSAEGRFSHQPQHRGTPTDARYTFSIRGAMQDIPAFSFQGSFSNGGEPERPFETNTHR
ncbi:MAG: hypothetical protein ACLQBD_30375 [Syntrophobacteraceae bacterium]